jgi:hypothetical protein
MPDGVCGGICGSIVASAILSVADLFDRHSVLPPPATAIPGQSAQNGVGMCGPGTFSPTCGGMVLYAGAPSPGAGGPGTSSWHTAVEDEYATENLQRFFIDLGLNSVDVIVLAPFHDARDAYSAASNGDYLTAVLLAGATTCEVAKPCAAVAGPLKGLARVAKSVNPHLPREIARVVAGNRKLATLGRPDAEDVFVVDADDIKGMNASQLAERLTIPDSDMFTVIRFPTPEAGLASPVFRNNPGFVPGGLTRGGAREYVIPNGPIPTNASIDVVSK